MYYSHVILSVGLSICMFHVTVDREYLYSTLFLWYIAVVIVDSFNQL